MKGYRHVAGYVYPQRKHPYVPKDPSLKDLFKSEELVDHLMMMKEKQDLQEKLILLIESRRKDDNE